MGEHKYEHINVGVNSRLDTLQAAVLIQKIKILNSEIISRNKVASNYNDALSNSSLILPPISDDNSYAWAQYTVRHENRNEIMNCLSEAGIPTSVYYPLALNDQVAYQDCNVVSSGTPNTKKFCQQVFSLLLVHILMKGIKKK